MLNDQLDKFCLIIPCNRTKFIKNLNNYYSKTKIKIKIIHNLNSINILKSYNSKNIKFIYDKNENIFFRILNGLKLTKEKYCMIAGDDDFLIEETVRKSINFLEKNKNFVSAQGLILSFDYKKKKLDYKNIDISLINEEIDSKYKYLRLFQAIHTRYRDRICTITKKKILIKIFESAKNLRKNYLEFIELYITICLTLLGRDMCFQDIGYLKGQHELNSHKHYKNNYLTWIFEKKFIETFYLSLKKFKKNYRIQLLFFFLLTMLFFFKIRVILRGRYKLVKFFSNTVTNLINKGRINKTKMIYNKNIKKITRIINI